MSCALVMAVYYGGALACYSELASSFPYKDMGVVEGRERNNTVSYLEWVMDVCVF